VNLGKNGELNREATTEKSREIGHFGTFKGLPFQADSHVESNVAVGKPANMRGRRLTASVLAFSPNSAIRFRIAVRL
jgi:hypothetical protein